MSEEKIVGRGIDTRFMLLNREAELATGLIAGGLSDLKNIPRGDSFYYESFYALSLGIERMLKLLLIVETPEVDLKEIGHDLQKLYKKIGIEFPDRSVEKELITFLGKFALRDRYSILDNLSNGSEDISNEPIAVFSTSIGQMILDKHEFKPFKHLVHIPEGLITMLHIEEDFGINEDPSQIILITKKREFIAKFTAMYAGRIIRPVLDRLETKSGAGFGNPYFEEHFVYIHGDDSYFKSRKTFRRV